MELSQSYLKECMSYNSDTGVLTWRKRPLEHFPSVSRWKGFNTQCAGNAVGSTDSGYRRVLFNGKWLYAHRIAWFYIYGEFPDGDIDHINGDRLDNRMDNLRKASHAENLRNQKLNKLNRSGVSGVSWHKRVCRWQARIGDGGGRKHLGYFDSFNDAAVARYDAEREHGYHENHGRVV